MGYTHLLFTLDCLAVDSLSTGDTIPELPHKILENSELPSLLKELKKQKYQLGVVVPENVSVHQLDFLSRYFEVVIQVENGQNEECRSKAILNYLNSEQIIKTDILYIGTDVCDMQCARKEGVNFGLAVWAARSVRHIYAAYYFNTPRDVAYSLAKQTDRLLEMPWLKWAQELQFIAQAGITYSKDLFDRERFERLREIAAEIMTLKTGLSPEYVKSVFCNETGFQTPKLDTRAAIFRDHKILLVKEKNNTWSLPGGWVDVNQSIKTNTVKEVKEEAGLDVVPVRLIALQDRNMHNLPIYAYGVCKAFVLCEVIGGIFEPNNETSESGYFGCDELPPLALEKNKEEQIRLCFNAYQSQHWEAVFD